MAWRAQCWCTQFAGHSFKKKWIQDNRLCYLLQPLRFCKAWGGRNMCWFYTSHECWFFLCVFFFSFLLETFHSNSAGRDLDREAKTCSHKHTLTCPPVAAHHEHILFCQSAREDADNSCHFTLEPSRWNSFIPLTHSCSPHWSSSEFILPLSIPFCCALPFLLLQYASLTRYTPLPLPIASQQWHTVCAPLGAGGGFYKLNWTRKQLKTPAKKMDPHAVPDAWPPLEIHFL